MTGLAAPGATDQPVDEVRVAGAGGVGLHVLVRNPDGNGTPMLLVHGLSSNARLWDGVASELAAPDHPGAGADPRADVDLGDVAARPAAVHPRSGVDPGGVSHPCSGVDPGGVSHPAAAGQPVAAVDQRGHGRSDKPDDGYDFPTLCLDLLAVIAALGWTRRPVVAAGQSWGGNVVLELAARHPSAVAAAALVDGGTIELVGRYADWPTCEAALAPPDLSATTAAGLEQMLRARHPDWPEAGIAGTLANVEVLADGTVRPWLSRAHHLTILRHLWEHRPSAVYPRLGVPVLLVPAGDPAAREGRYDAGKRQEVEAAAGALPVSAVRWVDGDHDLHAQHPALVAGLLRGAADGSVFTEAPG